MAKKGGKTVGIWVTDEEHLRLKLLADKQGRSVSALAREQVQKLLATDLPEEKILDILTVILETQKEIRSLAKIGTVNANTVRLGLLEIGGLTIKGASQAASFKERVAAIFEKNKEHFGLKTSTEK